jgi:hypothetical protein
VTERVAYVVFLAAVFGGMAVLTVGLVALVIALVRQNRRSQP